MIRAGLALAALAGLSACGGGHDRPDPRGVDQDETLLSVSATGEAEAVPDLATIMIGVETYGANAQAANAANSRKAAGIAKALEQFGVQERDLQTANLSLIRIEYGAKKASFRRATA